MTKQLIYILHLPNGTHLSTRPYKSYAGLQNAARTLIEEADMEPSTKKAYQQNASKQLAALGIANREYERLQEEAEKARVKAERKANPSTFVVLNASGTVASDKQITALTNKLDQICREMQSMKNSGRVTGDPIYKDLIKQRKALEAQLGVGK